MANWARNIIRFSTLMKVLTVVGLVSLILSYLSPFVHPNTFKIIPFFGLAYPIIVLGVLLSLVFWLFRKSKWSILVIVVLLIGGKLHFRTMAITFSEETEIQDESVWKVMSYNVRLFDVYNESMEGKLGTRNKIIEYVNSFSPDVVCFRSFIIRINQRNSQHEIP